MGKLTLKQRLVGTLVAAVGCTSLIALILMLVQNDTVELPPSFQYGIVFDAGSTHTALFLYKWLGKKENNTGVVSQVLVCDVEGPGISSYAHDPPAAGQSLTACLDDAKAAIPIGQERDTPVYLGATAGMRLLRLQDANKADQVMEEVAKKIKKYPFDFQGARILLGTEEGAYGWITINYLLERFIKYSFEGMWLKPKEGEILGALDMGGSSTQITFRPRDPLKDPISEVQLRLYGFNYNIYSHSYLCYGKEQAMRKLQIQLLKITNMSQQVYHPCYHHGYNLTLALGDLYNSPCAEKTDAFDPANFVTFLGTSDPGQCLKLVKTIFNFSDCSFPPNCAFNGIYQPPVYGNFFVGQSAMEFHCASLFMALTAKFHDYKAFSAYFYTFDFLGLAPQAPLPQVLSTIESFCKKDWLMVKTENPNIKDKYLLDYCASANYIMTLLQEAYKFNETTWSNIYFKKKVADTDVGWTLGYMLNLSSLIPSEHPLLMSGVKHEQWAAGVFFIVFALFLSLVVTVILCAVNINY